MNTINVCQVRTLERRLRELPDDKEIGIALRYSAKTIVVYYSEKDGELYTNYRISIFHNGNWRIEHRYNEGVIAQGEYGS